MNRKKIGIINVILIAAILIGVFVFRQATTVNGDMFVDALKQLEFSTVEIKITKEDGNGSETLISRELTAEELSSFYECLGASTYRTFDFGGRNIESPYRISVSFLDSKGNQATVILFTYDEYMDFHIHNENTQVSENCRITVSSLGAFWDTFISEATK